MKSRALLLAAGLSFAGYQAEAVSIDVSYSQDGWYYQLDIVPVWEQGETPIGGRFYIDGVNAGFGGGMGFDGDLPETLSAPWSPGIHTVRVDYNVNGEIQSVFGADFEILDPNGDAQAFRSFSTLFFAIDENGEQTPLDPDSVPDAGSTAALLSLGIAGLAWAGRSLQRHPV